MGSLDIPFSIFGIFGTSGQGCRSVHFLFLGAKGICEYANMQICMQINAYTGLYRVTVLYRVSVPNKRFLGIIGRHAWQQPFPWIPGHSECIHTPKNWSHFQSMYDTSRPVCWNDWSKQCGAGAQYYLRCSLSDSFSLPVMVLVHLIHYLSHCSCRCQAPTRYAQLPWWWWWSDNDNGCTMATKRIGYDPIREP